MRPLFLFLLFCPFCVKGQSPKAPEQQVYHTVRVSGGFNEAPFAELGYTRVLTDERPFHFGSYAWYVAAEADFAHDDNGAVQYYGIKAGWEASGWFLMYALELKYLAGSGSSQVLFTPKAGISVMGMANVLYGYILPAHPFNLDGIGHHQISLVVNINRKLLRQMADAGTGQPAQNVH